MDSLQGKDIIDSTTGIAMATSHVSDDSFGAPPQPKENQADRQSPCQNMGTSALAPQPTRPEDKRESFSSVRSRASRQQRNLEPTPAFSAPPGLISLMSLGTQHLIGQSTRFSTARPDFLLTSPLSLPAPHSSRVVHLRPARRDDIDALVAMAIRVGRETAEHERWLWPQMDKYPRDYERTLYWAFSSCFHDPKTVMLVAEVANQVGSGAEKVRRDIVGLLNMTWHGKKRKYDVVDGGRRYSGVNRVQLKPLIQQHFTDISYNIANFFDRARSRSRHRTLSSAKTTYLTAAESGLDRSRYSEDITSPDDTTTDTYDSKGEFWLIFEVSVDPAHAGTGIGGRLVRLATAGASERGELIILCAVPGREGFYEKCGYRRFGCSVIEGKEWVDMYHAPEEKEGEEDGGDEEGGDGRDNGGNVGNDDEVRES